MRVWGDGGRGEGGGGGGGGGGGWWVDGESLPTPPLVLLWSWASVVVLLVCTAPVGFNGIW